MTLALKRVWAYSLSKLTFRALGNETPRVDRLRLRCADLSVGFIARAGSAESGAARHTPGKSARRRRQTLGGTFPPRTRKARLRRGAKFDRRAPICGRQSRTSAGTCSRDHSIAAGLDLRTAGARYSKIGRAHV